jgi:hypothetical protein
MGLSVTEADLLDFVHDREAEVVDDVVGGVAQYGVAHLKEHYKK